jgi:peptidoglycan/xylan/chitin deacetylase (PgdA/CDA1 family)
MNWRHLLSPLWLSGWRMVRPLFPEKPGSLRILIFHDVKEEQFPALERLFEHISENQRFVTPEMVEESFENPAETWEGERVLVTFDDGFVSNLDVAKEILPIYGIRAVFFVCPGLIDLDPALQNKGVGKFIFRGKPPKPVPRLMGWGHLEELGLMGHTLGAHSLTHRSLASLSGAELEKEIIESGERIKLTLARPVTWFAWPFGDISTVSPEALETAERRYRFCRSGVRGLNHATSYPGHLFAGPVDLDAPFAYQLLALEGGLDPAHAKPRRKLDAMAKSFREMDEE